MPAEGLTRTTSNGAGATCDLPGAVDVIDVRAQIILNEWDDVTTNIIPRITRGSGGSINWSAGLVLVNAPPGHRCVASWVSLNGNVNAKAIAVSGDDVPENGATIWVRVVHDFDNGSNQNVVSLHHSDDNENWTLIGSSTQSPAITFDDSTVTYEVSGCWTDTGALLQAEIYADETLVGCPNFTTDPALDPDRIVDRLGNVWVLSAEDELVGYSAPGVVGLAQ